MQSTGIPWLPLVPFGAEIELDLTQPLTAAQMAELQALYDEHGLLVFRGQTLSHDQQIEFVSRFGPPLLTPQDGVGYISNQAGQGGLGGGELAFHSDLSFSPEPFLGISLHAVDVVDDRSSTRFINASLGYRELSEATKARLQKLSALHVYTVDFAKGALGDIPDGLPQTARALVMAHPRTGKPILYANLNQTARILELEPEHSLALLQELFDHLYAPQRVYEHRWRMGDLVLWDNLSLQHARGDVSDVGARTLQRVVLAEKGFFEQHPQFQLEEFLS